MPWCLPDGEAAKHLDPPPRRAPRGSQGLQSWDAALHARQDGQRQGFQCGHALQSGHRGSAVERELLLDLPVFVALAMIGPRRLSRGKCHTSGRHPGPPVRFNGATAFQPWKVPGEKLLRSRRFSKRVSSGGWGLPTTCAVAIGTRELGCKDGATSRNHWFEWVPGSPVHRTARTNRDRARKGYSDVRDRSRNATAHHTCVLSGRRARRSEPKGCTNGCPLTADG